MSKRSFIEEELARESKARVDSQKPSLRQRFDQLLHKAQKNVKTALDIKSPSKEFCEGSHGLCMTPNEVRVVYACPPLPKNETLPSSSIASIYNRTLTESLYESAIQAMHTYGKGEN